MVKTIPITEVKIKPELAEFIHKTNERVFVTNENEDDLVIMSNEAYADLYCSTQQFSDLIQKLDNESYSEDDLIPADEVFQKLKDKYGAEV
jgi:hypothetical protein